MNAAKEEIMILFLIKNFGFIAYYLELQVERDRQARTIYFIQIAYIDRILEEAGMQNCRSASISMDPKLLIKKSTRGESVNYCI
jgi:hypothetical protein